jgi:hypothetical protein
LLVVKIALTGPKAISDNDNDPTLALESSAGGRVVALASSVVPRFTAAAHEAIFVTGVVEEAGTFFAASADCEVTPPYDTERVRAGGTISAERAVDDPGLLAATERVDGNGAAGAITLPPGPIFDRGMARLTST